MSALLIGFVLVVASAAVFGHALFGRRPVPQPAMARGASPRVGTGAAESAPSRLTAGKVTAARAAGSDSPVIVRPPDDPGHIGSDDVRVPFGVRVRSAALLTVAVIGAAILVGVVLAIVVVGAVLLVA